LLEVLFVQLGPNGLEVVLQQIAQPKALLAGEICLALEHAPSGLLQDRLLAILRQTAGLGGTHIIKSFVHFGHDVKSIEKIHVVDAALADDWQVRLTGPMLAVQPTVELAKRFSRQRIEPGGFLRAGLGLETTRGRIMSCSSCSRMWQFHTYSWPPVRGLKGLPMDALKKAFCPAFDRRRRQGTSNPNVKKAPHNKSMFNLRPNVNCVFSVCQGDSVKS
jgi:hypothetical protein